MNCYYHPDREVVGTCVSCGKLICTECRVILGDKFYCNPCANQIFSGKAESAAIAVENTSGQGKLAVVPREVKGWNWGAFLLTFVWSIWHKAWIGVLLVLFVVIITVVTSQFDTVGLIGWLAAIVTWIVLGVKGNEWAWQNKRWDSIEHFKKTQRTWAWWGVGLTISASAIGFIVGFTG